MEVEKAAKIAVQNVFKEGLTDVFPTPFEVNLLKNQEFQKKVVENVIKCIKGGSFESLEVSQIDHVLVPKGGPFDFRRVALIHPLDTIKYLALALVFADDLEKLRPKKIMKNVFSYRYFYRKGLIFDKNYNIRSFQRYCSKKKKQKDVKAFVECDIANFYDRLNLHRLESILLSAEFDKIRVKQVNELLLFWANRDSYSLPVGSNASRVFAEAALLEVDNYLLSHGIKFCRYVDDYRLFAPDMNTAHYWLTQLIERLWQEGLTINQRKTKIEDVSSQKKVVSDGGGSNVKPEEHAHKVSKVKSEQEPQRKILAGYGGPIPTRFRRLNEKAIEQMKDSDPEQLLNTIEETSITKPEDVISFIKSVIASSKFQYFVKMPELADLYPQFTPYIIDVLIKNNDKISADDKKLIKDGFSDKLTRSLYLPEYITIEIVKLLGCDGFQDKTALMNLFRGLKRNAGAYIGRSLLDSLENLVSRSDVLEIRKYFLRADSWEKRQIVKIVDKQLNEDEKRPFLKNIKTQEARDLFLVEFLKPTAFKKK